MKRIFSLFLVVLLLASVICMTAFASEVYYLEGTDYGFRLEDNMPSGYYYVELYYPSVLLVAGYTTVPVYFDFSEYFSLVVPSGSFCFYDSTMNYYMPDGDLFFESRLDYGDSDFIEVFHSFDNTITYLSGTGTFLHMELIPASTSSSMVAVLDTDVISGVFSSLFNLITSNPLFSALCAGSLILVCIPLFVDLKKSSR